MFWTLTMCGHLPAKQPYKSRKLNQTMAFVKTDMSCDVEEGGVFYRRIKYREIENYRKETQPKPLL